MVTYCADAYVDNPNLWLANRLGLINPATVIWDLIPWSFVVNMFVNVNQMVSSVTDEVGLNISNRSVTQTARVVVECLNYDPDPDYGTSFARYYIKNKNRVVGSAPKIGFQFKLPQVNWELAVIATSLVVQKFKRVNDLIRVV